MFSNPFVSIVVFSFFVFSCTQNDTNEVAEKNQEGKIYKADSVILDSSESHSNIIDFVVEGFEILDSVKGNLNLDNYPDVILVLKKKGEEKLLNDGVSPGKRPLLILVGKPNNTYVLAASNDSTVLCGDCGGVHGDLYEGVTIKNGYFSIEHFGGSGWKWTRIVTYKFSKEESDWFLHKDGTAVYHVSEPNKVESNVLTTKDFGVMPFEKYNIYQK